MVSVIRAKVLGYCMGVRRAVDSAEKALAEYPDRVVYSLGPLIHNKTALERLEKQGLRMLDVKHIDEFCAELMRDGTNEKKMPVVIIRAHGTPPAVRRTLQKAGVLIVDATCPRVLVNQKRAADYTAQGYMLVIAGDKNHGEVAAVAGVASDKGINYAVVQNRREAQKLAVDSAFCRAKAVLISQTTFSETEYKTIQKILCRTNAQLTVFDTICPATRERQKALHELCAAVDGVLVIGGKNSANTKCLFQTAQKLSPRVAYIENTTEIPQEFLHLKKVGITAGASTPDELIADAERFLQKMREA